MWFSIIVFSQDLYQVGLSFYVFEGLHGGRINSWPAFDQILKYVLYAIVWEQQFIIKKLLKPKSDPQSFSTV